MIKFVRLTGNRFNNLKSNKIPLCEMLMMWDNARPHSSKATQAFLTSRKIHMVPQPPYSPDLNLCDRFLFRKLKSLTNDYDFIGHEDVYSGVKRAMKLITEEELAQQLRKLRDHAFNVIEAGSGEYISEI